MDSDEFRQVQGFFRKPIGVSGCSRSGTTVLRGAISQHPQVVGRVEEITEMKDLIAEMRERWASEASDELREKVTYSIFESAFGDSYGRRVLEDLNGSVDRKAWMCEMKIGQIEWAFMREMFPKFRLIIILRDGVGVVHSMVKRFNILNRRGIPFQRFCEKWSQFVADSLWANESPDALIVRHEDLLGEREETFRRIWRFVDLPYDEAPTRFAKTKVIHPLDQPHLGMEDAARLFESRSEAWREWDASERETFRSICSPMMEALGYAIPF